MGGGVLPICRDAVGVFYNQRRVGYGCLVLRIKSYLDLEIERFILVRISGKHLVIKPEESGESTTKLH